MANRILQGIRDGSLSSEGKLPTERGVASFLGTSRIAAREALIVLETLGFIEMKGKEGIFVRKLQAEELNRGIEYYFSWPLASLPQAYHVRIILEAPGAALAACHRTAEDLNRIEACLVELSCLYRKRPIDIEAQGGVLNDLFHRLVMEAAHNEVLLRIHEGLSGAIRKMSEAFGLNRLVTPLNAWQERIIEGHRRIFQRILEQDQEGARQAMQEHLEITARKIEGVCRDRMGAFSDIRI